MSFAAQVKENLCAMQVKKSCCKRALLLGMLCPQYVSDRQELSFSTDNDSVQALFAWVFRQVTSVYAEFDSYEQPHGHTEKTETYFKLKLPRDVLYERTVEAIERSLKDFSSLFVCDNCRSCFLRGLFLTAGTVSAPERKGYHLELLFKSTKVRACIATLLNENALSPKMISRPGSQSLYLKDSETIQDFLTLIGAQRASLAFMGAKIYREIRNNENRRSNCDTSNISRSTLAADTQLRAIRALVTSGKISLLPPNLQITAKLRLEHPECSLPEIAAMHEPALTKSGVNHRLQKIIQFATEIIEI